jgi:hypothetical protein
MNFCLLVLLVFAVLTRLYLGTIPGSSMDATANDPHDLYELLKRPRWFAHSGLV